jgi:O-antigen/teichoic acid export membrane protein
LSFAVKLKNTLFKAFVIRFATVGLDLLFFGYILKRLPVEEVGLYNWAMAVLVFGGLFLDMGINQVLIREISAKKDVSSAIGGAFKLRLPFVGLGAVVFAAWYLYGGSTQVVYMAVAYTALVTVGNYFDAILQSYMWAIERQTASNMLLLQNSLLRLIAGLIVMELMGSTEAVELLGGLVVAKVVNFTIVFQVYRYYRRRYPVEGEGSAEFAFRSYAFASLTYLGLGAVNAFRQRADWIFIESWLDKAALANYALANKIFEVFFLMWVLVLVTVYPWQCRMLSEGGVTGRYRLFFGLSAIIAFTTGFFIYDFAPYIIELVYADKFEPAFLPTRILAITLAFAAVFQILTTLLMAKGMDRAVLYVGLGAVGSQIALDLVLIPRYGIEGAAAAMLISYAFGVLISLFVSGRSSLVGFKEAAMTLPAIGFLCMGFWASMYLPYPALRSLAVILVGAASVFGVYLRGEDRTYVLGVLKGRLG